MSELQSTIEFSVELYKFYNVDLFQRGMYQVRCSVRPCSRSTPAEVEVAIPSDGSGGGRGGLALGCGQGACHPFQILYRNEEVPLRDVLLFRVHQLMPHGRRLRDALQRCEFQLHLELWFAEHGPGAMTMVSSRVLQIHLRTLQGLHYHLPVLFDYFHLSAVTVTVHAHLTALHQPSIKRGILRYMQSCTPKSSKSWSKPRHSLSVDQASTQNCRGRSGSTLPPWQVQREAWEVLVDAGDALRDTIREYRSLMDQQEDGDEEYGTLVERWHRQQMRGNKSQTQSSLAELCAANIRLWSRFLSSYTCKGAVQQHLSKIHHQLRVRRFAELFFVVRNPRQGALGCHETACQSYPVVTELARRSKYLNMLPPLPIHCTALDGDCTTMPIIFEDQYQDSFDSLDDISIKNISPSISSRDFGSFKKSKSIKEDSLCSCGIGNLWDMRKSSEKTLVNVDFVSFDDALNFTMPTRHSKSLDQLQLSSRYRFQYSMSSILRDTTPCDLEQRAAAFYTARRPLKNVASEHNMRHLGRKYREANSLDQTACLCQTTNQGNTSTLTHKTQRTTRHKPLDTSIENNEDSDCFVDKKHKQFNIRNFKNVKQQCQKIVKSFSHTSSDSTQNIFRSSSMQFFSPKKLVSGVNKFNSLVSRRGQNRERRTSDSDGKKQPSQVNGHFKKISQKTNNENMVHKSKSSYENGTVCFRIGSTSSSTESLSMPPGRNTLSDLTSSPGRTTGIRKVKSNPCLVTEQVLVILSGTESLPNIISQVEEKEESPYGELQYLSSSPSSTTSEQSGWITSRSSSVASSSADPHIGGGASLPLPLDGLHRKLVRRGSSRRGRHRGTSLNGQPVKGHKNDELILFKGCDLLQITQPPPAYLEVEEEIALPPPKQFRDLESPTPAVTNGRLESPPPPPPYLLADTVMEQEDEEEEINAVDNILYHVIDVMIARRQERRDAGVNDSKEGKAVKRRENGESESQYAKSSWYLHEHRQFLKSREEFKSTLPITAQLYSELPNLDTSPYFHISDEFRVFSPEGMHLVICVHGLDGNSADLRLVKTYLELGLPGAYLDFLMSERNQGDTFSDFETMTDRLIGEILQYLDGSTIRPSRVSFVGHSLGNIIIRSALTRPQLRFLLPRLHTFLSLSGPHLGTLYNSSGLVNMGMWFMQKWKKSGSLLQLCLKDAADVRQSFLYRLSQRSNLHHFRNLLLCGSGQDRYVPLHSARVELCREAVRDGSELGAVYREMVHHVLAPVLERRDCRLLRYDVHHALPNTANALIGRAAHIAVLDSELFLEKFMAVVGIKYFR